MVSNVEQYKIKMYKYKIERNDIIKFVIYTSVFLLLFAWYNRVQSPINQYDLNSASPELTNTSSFNSFDVWEKKQEKPYLTISFKPDLLKVDDNILEILKTNINSKFFKDKVTPLSLVIDWTRVEPRGQVSWDQLTLSSHISSPEETIKVFVHELWHITDLNYLSDKDWYDMSNEFYSISWVDYNIKKKDAKIEDFVSWYALTNKYEDFAESFCFYVFHNEDFYAIWLKDNAMKQKYDFLSKYIFSDNEFSNTSFGTWTLASYNWDITKIWINLKKYLYFIQ